MERLNITDLSQRTRADDTNDHSRGRTLLLDDDDASLRLMYGVLRTAGYECITTHRAEEALEIVAQQSSIKVVVSDICMPDVDGLMFLDRLHELQRTSPLPQVLFLTGNPSLDNAIAALRRGALDFLVKPLRPRELLDAVNRAHDRATHIASSSDSATVEHLANQAEALANRLRMLTPSASTTQARGMQTSIASHLSDTSAPMGAPPQNRTEQLLDTMEQLRRLQRRYHTVLGEMDDVAWDLLVETFRSCREGKKISVSGLSISLEGISSTTALRRINELVARGHLQRIPDPADARRDFIVLDPKAQDALEDYLARVAIQLNQAPHTSSSS